MSEATLVTGTPQLALNIGGTPVQANYASGSGSTSLVFTYTIVAGQTDSDGISITANSLSLPVGASLSDTAGNSATLTHIDVANNSSYLVAAAARVDLSQLEQLKNGFAINGQAAGDWNGFRVSGAGDVNGDGLSDVIVSSRYGDPTDRADAGRSYVVFGKAGTLAVNLSDVANGSGGFVINGQSAGDQSGQSVSNLGDVNGDGLADLLVGSRFADPSGLADAGKAYVVYGKKDTAATDLGSLGSGATAKGFTINGQAANDWAGITVSGAGDVNGDGLADMLVGAILSDPTASKSDAGRSYVVFGRTTTADVDLANLGTRGFVINGQSARDESGSGLSSAGDVNGDGLADIIVGADFSDPTGGSEAGRSYVVFGKADNSAVELSTVAGGTGGFVINGEATRDYSGASVSSAGDVNGDGLTDLIVGAPNYGADDVGRSYVIFGKANTASVELSAVANGIGGFVITGVESGGLSGTSVSSAGDMNGDGLSDLIIGAPGRNGTLGHSYVVFGKTDSVAVDLGNLGTKGFVINGESAGDFSGASVSSAGDINGDGLADLLVGAYGVNGAAGRSYVIFGSSADINRGATAVDFLGTSGNDTLTGTVAAETIIGGAGDDTINSNGGADVIYAGKGNDVITVNASMVTALSSSFGAGGNTQQLARVDGGGGIDTLELSGSGITLDLTLIANQGNSSGEGLSRINSIERIDLTGSGSNVLKLSAKDVLDITDVNQFNDGIAGWSGLGSSVARHQLVVDGNENAVLTSSGWGAVINMVYYNNNDVYTAYYVYNQGMAQLLVNTAILQQQVI